MELLIAVLFILPLYVLPGLAFFQIFQFKNKISLWDRLVISIFTSIIIISFAFTAVGNIFHFIPAPIHLLVFSAVLFIIAFFLQLSGRKPVLQYVRVPEQLKIPRVEKIFIWLFIIGYAMIANLPRIIMFVQGGQLMESAPLDEPWHIAELVSVARSGIPPMHYLFPDLKLIYYYAAWIYPAIMGNSAIVQISLIRAMSIHVFMITFSFLAVIYYLIYSNIRSSLVRIAGILMFTLMGGFDLFIKLPGIEFIDWWPLVSRWIVSNLQISQFSTLFVWVPHHVAAAMSFGLLLLLWRNTAAALMIKAVLSGLLLGFCFITSPFVFLFSIFALGLMLLFNAKVLIKDWKQIAPLLLIAVLVFTIGVWYSATLYLQQNNGGFGFRDFYINVIETLRGGSGISLLLDRVITVLGFPLLAGWIGLIELGLAFLLYSSWMIKEFVFSSSPNRKPMFIVLALFPLISMFLIFFIEDRGGGDNFGMRGFIPAQMCIVFAGLLFLDELGQKNKLSRWQILALVYIFGCFLIAQSLSSFAEIRAHSVRPIKVVLSQNIPKKMGIGEEINPNWPVNYDYIHWLNKNTPNDSLILDGCPPEENVQYRYLERIRFLDPRCMQNKSILTINDFVFIQPEEYNHLLELSANAGGDLLNLFSMSDWSKKDVPTYYVDHGTIPIDPQKMGAMVYQDTYVTVYQMK